MRGWVRRKGWRGIKVSSLVHEEQHLRWLGQEPWGCQKTWSERRLWAVCRGEARSWVLRLVVELIQGFRRRQAPGQGLLRVGQSGWLRGQRVVFTCSRYFLWELIRLREGKCSVPGERRGARKMTPYTIFPFRLHPYTHTHRHKQDIFMPHALTYVFYMVATANMLFIWSIVPDIVRFSLTSDCIYLWLVWFCC